MEQKIRLGIVGAGRIVARVMADMHNAQEIELTAIAGMNREEAENAAEKYGAKMAFSSFEAMAESDEIDLAYIAIPNPFHEKYACLMMNHGKHVLCEKPMGLNDTQVGNMIECARKNRVFLMEAMWTRFLPAVQKMKQMIDEGAVGEVNHTVAAFSFAQSNRDENDRVYRLDLGGGALLDLGVYPLMLCTMVLGSQPNKIQGVCTLTPQGVDLRTCGQLMYENGKTAQFFCGMDASSNQLMTIHGSMGMMMLPESWHATSFIYRPKGGEQKEFVFRSEHEGHHYEFDHVAHCIKTGLTESPVIPLKESLNVSRICRFIRHTNGIVYPGETIE